MNKKQLIEIKALLDSFHADLEWKEMYSPADCVPGEKERCERARENVARALVNAERRERITSAGH